MTVTFADARRIIHDAVAPHWRPEDGTLVVTSYGWEDDRSWRANFGAREWIEDGDPAFQRLDAPVLLVDKETGAVELLVVIESFDRLGAMRRIGTHPDN